MSLVAAPFRKSLSSSWSPEVEVSLCLFSSDRDTSKSLWPAEVRWTNLESFWEEVAMIDVSEGHQ